MPELQSDLQTPCQTVREPDETIMARRAHRSATMPASNTALCTSQNYREVRIRPSASTPHRLLD
jgi:hypothetical protein